jgi:hypothetical protein
VQLYVGILQELPSFEKKLPNAIEVISHVANEARIQGFGRGEGQVLAGLLLLQSVIGEELQELDWLSWKRI